LQKHALLRGISLSKLINDILTIWLYQATPRAAVDFFFKQHCPPWGDYRGPRSQLTGDGKGGGFYIENGSITPEALFDALADKINRRKPGQSINDGFHASSYADDGIRYVLPPFPKDVPEGYLRSIGYRGEAPMNEISKWLDWAAGNSRGVPP
jgi:hypothetical protein